MSFPTLTYLLFFVTVFTLYWGLRTPRRQSVLLVAASYVFYGWWDYRFCALLAVSSLIDYGVGLRLVANDGRRRQWLALSLCVNLGLLGYFKYHDFFLESLAEAFGWSWSPLMGEVLLPAGISFYTFQTLSYTVDVYRGKLTPTRDLAAYLAYVSFFPQLVAGPIERGTRLLPQFLNTRTFDPSAAREGCKLILWGLFKKLAIADRLAEIVDPAYRDPAAHSGAALALATVCFSFQIYCDFSAYSEIARGSAKLLGIDLMRNFRFPYFAAGFGEFWRRWHISLSTWFRDYVYIPLGGSRAGRWRHFRNLVVTFLVSGLWHGAAWRFVVWGALHGVLVVVSSYLPGRYPSAGRWGPALRVALVPPTFLLTTFLWIFFRADSVSQAGLIARKVLTDVGSSASWAGASELLGAIPEASHTLTTLVAFLAWEVFQRNREVTLDLPTWPRALRWLIYSGVVWWTLDAAALVSSKPFIYFAF